MHRSEARIEGSAAPIPCNTPKRHVEEERMILGRQINNPSTADLLDLDGQGRLMTRARLYIRMHPKLGEYGIGQMIVETDGPRLAFPTTGTQQLNIAPE